MSNSLFGIKDASRYTGLKVETIRYHIYVSKRLSPQRIGHSLVFTKVQLDKFLAHRPKPGRPRKGK